MYPSLFGEGAWALPAYSVMLMLGFFLATWLSADEAKRQGWDDWAFIKMCLALLVAGVVGARFFHLLFDGFLQDYIDLCTDPNALAASLPDGSPCTESAQCLAAQQSGVDIGGICQTETGQCVPEQDCLRPLKFWAGGLTWYGGFLFSFATTLWFSKTHAWNWFRTLDTLAVTLPLGLAMGRVGCFLSGCCYGGVCDAPWGIRFPLGSEAYRTHAEENPGGLIDHHASTGIWESLPVHPTQLYEAGGLLLIFAAFWFGLRFKKQFHGQIMGWYLVLYGLLRFTVEFWRADARGALAGVSTSQWISLILVPIGVAMLVRGYRSLRGPNPPRFQAGIPIAVAEGSTVADGESD